jgi:hypothetical protein
MIVFFRTEGCSVCSELQAGLEALGMPHKIIVIRAPPQIAAGSTCGRPPAVLMNGKSVMHGHQDIREHLAGLAPAWECPACEARPLLC